jgi:hypothetical protein
VTIDQAYRFVNFIANKEQKGNIKPNDFNLLAISAQLEAVMNCLGNQKRLNDVFVPQSGYKVNQQMKERILPLIKQSQVLTTGSGGKAPYPSDYFGYDSIQHPNGTIVTIVESDQLARMKKSLITPPTDDDPFACFHGDGIEIAPASFTNAYLFYVKRPVDPNFDYNYVNQVAVFNTSTTPQLSGKVSQNFEASERLHREICMIILSDVGINLSDERMTAYANQVIENRP